MGIGRLAIAALLSALPCIVLGHPGPVEHEVLHRIDWFLGAMAAAGILGGLIYHQWLLYKDRTDED